MSAATDTMPPRKGVTAWHIYPLEENGDEFFVLTFHHGLGRMTRLDLGPEDVRDLARYLADVSGPSAVCRFCQRRIYDEGGVWIDPEATGDDSIWRETCGDNDGSFTAEHEPEGG